MEIISNAQEPKPEPEPEPEPEPVSVPVPVQKQTITSELTYTYYYMTNQPIDKTGTNFPKKYTRNDNVLRECSIDFKFSHKIISNNITNIYYKLDLIAKFQFNIEGMNIYYKSDYKQVKIINGEKSKTGLPLIIIFISNPDNITGEGGQNKNITRQDLSLSNIFNFNFCSNHLFKLVRTQNTWSIHNNINQCRNYTNCDDVYFEYLDAYITTVIIEKIKNFL